MRALGDAKILCDINREIIQKFRRKSKNKIQCLIYSGQKYEGKDIWKFSGGYLDNFIKIIVKVQ